MVAVLRGPIGGVTAPSDEPDGIMTRYQISQSSSSQSAVTQDYMSFPTPMLRKKRFIGYTFGERGTWRRYPTESLRPINGHLCHVDEDGVIHRADKLPVNVRTGRAASVSDPSTWSTFDEVFAAYAQGAVDGIGYVLDRGEFLIDIDGCMDGGTPNEFATYLISKLDTYAEASISNEGCHIIGYCGDYEPTRGCKSARCEVYVGGHTKRFCTVSGNVIDGHTTLEDCADVFADFYETEFRDHPVRYSPGEGAIEFPQDGTVISDGHSVSWTIGHYKHGRALYERGDISGWAADRAKYLPKADNSRSEADFALAKMLLAATDGNLGQTLRLMRKSAMRRGKYDEIHDGTNTYAAMTVRNAAEACDVAAIRAGAFKRRDKRLEEYPPSMAEIVPLMRRDDITHYMLREVMCTRAQGTARRRWRDPVSTYPAEWILRWWDELVDVAYQYDFGKVR